MKRRFRFLATLLSVSFLAIFAPHDASASTIFTYTGSNYTTAMGSYTNQMFMSVSIELANPLGANYSGTVAPIHFSINDGLFVIDDQNPFLVVADFFFQTDGAGAIKAWQHHVYVEDWPNFTLDLRIENQINPFFPQYSYQLDAAEHNRFLGGENSANYYVSGPHFAGTWGIENYDVPEPASLSLVLIGLAGVGLQFRRRRSQ